MTRSVRQNKRSPLDNRRLRDLALAYVGRFATSREKLIRYLSRKLRERGWEGDGPPPLDDLAADFARLGYVDDRAYARMKGGAMERRGLGPRRVGAALAADGIADPDRAEAVNQARQGEWEAAEILARRKKIGPYSLEIADRPLREKHLAAFLRAGHDMATARAWVDAAPGAFPERSE